MEVIAKTANGLLIQATENEIREIVNAVNGTKPEKIEIGQKIPAIDYAATITKVKSLKNSSNYKSFLDYYGYLAQSIDNFKKSVEDASNISI